jgi:hypothetical protein
MKKYQLEKLKVRIISENIRIDEKIQTNRQKKILLKSLVNVKMNHMYTFVINFYFIFKQKNYKINRLPKLKNISVYCYMMRI